jgi:hypothetical protein
LRLWRQRRCPSTATVAMSWVQRLGWMRSVCLRGRPRMPPAEKLAVAPGLRPQKQRSRTGPPHTATATALAAALAAVCLLTMHKRRTRAPLRAQPHQYEPLHCRRIGRRRVRWPTDTARVTHRSPRPSPLRRTYFYFYFYFYFLDAFGVSAWATFLRWRRFRSRSATLSRSHLKKGVRLDDERPPGPREAVLQRQLRASQLQQVEAHIRVG